MDAEVRARRKDVVSALREVSAASICLKALVAEVEAVADRAIEQMKGGSGALHLAESMGMADRREALNAAEHQMRKSRHDVQRAIFLLALAEGSSRAEIARIWRVSRQLVSRMTGEEAGGDES